MIDLLTLKYLVFLHDDSTARYDAQVILQIIECLLEEGEGSFKDDFDRLFEKSEIIEKKQAYHKKEVIHERKKLTLPSGISFELAYGDDDYSPGDTDKSFPVITSIQANDYIHELDPLS